jgi:hypothetical protein
MSRSDRAASRRAERFVLGRYAALAVAAGGIGWVTAAESHTGTPPPVVGLACFVGGLLAGAAAIVWAAYRPPPGSLATMAPRRRTDRESGGLQRVERTLERGLNDVDRFNDRVRPWLVRLTEQRLRHHAALDLYELVVTEPESAHQLLGGSLCKLIREPRTTAPTRPELAEWVARIEAL